MNVDVARRAQLAVALLSHLAAAIPGSDASLRGSLAEGRADSYSDIDLLWDVPDRDLAPSLVQLPAILSRIYPVASLRFDPDFQNSARRRLVFIRFAGLPLFWRVDLDILAHSIGCDDAFDRDNPLARGTDWSYAESSLANSVAAIKAHLRGQVDTAAALLERAEQRVGLSASAADLPSRILRLTDRAVTLDPTQHPFAAEIRKLAAHTSACEGSTDFSPV